MNIIQQLNHLKEERNQAQQKVREMEADLLIAIQAVTEVLRALEMDKQLKQVNKQPGVKAKIQIGKIITSVLPKLMSGKLETKRLTELWEEIAPILPKYQYLLNQKESLNSQVDKQEDKRELQAPKTPLKWMKTTK